MVGGYLGLESLKLGYKAGVASCSTAVRVIALQLASDAELTI